ncbi:hypothetical protein BSKO_11081 [Bryopsis sp. KO-2023]|nr:hypothetical protein BSKO_11081 [Bryopsis sp. KO-2023]
MSLPSVTLGLKYQARVLRPQIAEKEKSQWYVATNSLREENEVRLVEYDPSSESIQTVDAFVHPNEVWDVAPHPSKPEMFFTVHNKDGAYGVTLWSSEHGSRDLHSNGELEGFESRIRRVLWHKDDDSKVVSVDEGNLSCWDVGNGAIERKSSASAGDLQQLWSGTWSRSDINTLCTAGGNGFTIWDLRSMEKAGDVQGAHEMPVRDVDISPNGGGTLLTCGDDCAVKQWDSRNLGEPMLTLTGHSHWIWNCCYNPFHPEMLLSSSSDSLVVLWSNTPLGTSPENSPTSPSSGPMEGRIHDYDDHEDSVYGLAWSEVDPWTVASLSYDGRIVVNKVPSDVKYKILI